MGRFVATADARALDAACLEQLAPPPPFLAPTAGVLRVCAVIEVQRLAEVFSRGAVRSSAPWTA